MKEGQGKDYSWMIYKLIGDHIYAVRLKQRSTYDEHSIKSNYNN